MQSQLRKPTQDSSHFRHRTPFDGNQQWSIFQRLDELTARARSAESTLSTRSLSTRPVRLPFSLRVSDDTTESSEVMVVRPSRFSTRRPRPPRRLSSDWSALLARPRLSFHSSDASTSNSVVTRNRRARLSSSNCFMFMYQKVMFV